MLARMHRWATALWLALACGAGLGFLARDLLGLSGLAVALAWFAGAALGAACGLHSGERGASVL